MSKHSKLPTQARLRELLTYCQESGQLLWRVTRGPSSKAGTVAGCPREKDGPWMITIDGRAFQAHAVVWKLLKGRRPPGPLLHINGQRDDNRIENLRPIKGAAGPYTLERIREKCDVVGDCWHWTAGKSGKAPALRHEGKVMNARHYIFTELLGKKLQPGRMVSFSCANDDCVSPDHLVQYTRSQLQRRTARRTGYAKNPARIAKLSAAKRAASPYSEDFVKKVRAMEGTAKGIARQLGMCASTVNEWRNGEVRKPINNPFAGLLAA